MPEDTYTAAQALVDSLISIGIKNATCVPGESYLAVLDAIVDRRDDFSLFTCRQEGGAATMAEAIGRLTGQCGVCFVTRGPGATNASIGVHNAKQNGTPLMLFIGQVAREHRGREAFQEVDFETMFAPLAKWSVEINDPDRVVEIINQANTIATSGRPGPVVISLPEDILTGSCAASPTVSPKRFGKTIDPEFSQEVTTRLSEAKKPLVIVGGTSFDEASAKRFTELCETAHIPIISAFRRQSLIDHRSPAYAGVLGLGPDPRLMEKINQSDCILALGTRLGDIVSQGYTLFKTDRVNEMLIHITEDEHDLNRVFPASATLAAQSSVFINNLAQPDNGERLTWFENARRDYEAFADKGPGTLQLCPDFVFKELRRLCSDDVVITNGAGNFSIWAHRYFPLHSFNSQLGPVSGAMGYALPAALGAAALGREAIAVTGDGDFMMTVQELATAAHHGLKVIVLLLNNNMYGTIRMHQERHYPNRISATDLTNPNFADLALAHGLNGVQVTRNEDVQDVLHKALQSHKTTVIELICDKNQLTPNLRIEN